MKMLKLFFPLLLSCVCFGASPSICTAAGNIATLADFLTPSKWSGCTADGGPGIKIWGVITTIPANVPGAAGKGDIIVVPSGITVHVPKGLGIELSEGTAYPGIGDAITVQGANSVSFGHLIIDAGAVVKPHGTSSSTGNNFASIAQYGVWSIAPNGSLWVGATQNNPQFQISGRFYSGCADTTQYPTPDCTEPSGVWVVAHTAGACPDAALTAGCFTATSMPSGFVGGDLVEISRPQLPTAWGYPYTATSLYTSAPAPATLPLTNDTGTADNNICGLAVTCPIPEGMILSIVSRVGNSVILGWPRGGNSDLPYSTGAETAAQITDAGTGQLWLSKPAFIRPDPALITWGTSQSLPGGVFTPTSGYFDAIRTGAVVSHAPISNAAGTGPGRIGDNSLTFTANNVGAVNNDSTHDPCHFRKVEDVTSTGCYLNYSNGAIMSFLFGATSPSATGTYMTSSGPFSESGAFVVPSGARTYNEMVIANTDIRGILATAGFFQFSRIPNSANNRMAFLFNDVGNGGGEVSMGTQFDQANGANGSASSPIQIIGNSFFGSSITTSTYPPHVMFNSNSSYVDVSQNYIVDWHSPIGCFLNYTGATSPSTFDHVTVANNNVPGGFLGGSDNTVCRFTNAFLADNRITGIGAPDSYATGGPGYSFAYQDFYNADPTKPNIWKNNIIYGSYRTGELMGNNQHYYESTLFNWHHVYVMPGSLGGLIGSYIPNEVVDHGLVVAYDQAGQPVDGFDSGFNSSAWIDHLRVSNMTWLGMHNSCFMIGDTDAQFTLLTDLQVTNNVCNGSSGGTFFRKSQGTNVPGFTSWQGTLMAYNSTQGTLTPYAGVTAPNNNGMAAPTYNRNVLPTMGGRFYNFTAARQVTGVALQNPSYTTAITTGSLKWIRTSSTDVTAQWSAGGVTYGAPVELNWGGAGTSYSVTGVSSTGVTDTNVTLTVSGTPFSVVTLTSGIATPAGAPITRMAVKLSGANVGAVYYISRVPATNQIVVVGPDVTGWAVNDIFAIMQANVLLADESSGSMEIGIDWRATPATNGAYVDSGITAGFADYCSDSTKCFSGGPLISGLPNSLTPGTTNLPLLATMSSLIPSAGGSSQLALCSSGAAPCSGELYLPPATLWKTSGLYNGYLGVAAPLPAASVPQRKFQ